METEPVDPAPFNVTKAPEATVCDMPAFAIGALIILGGRLTFFPVPVHWFS